MGGMDMMSSNMGSNMSKMSKSSFSSSSSSSFSSSSSSSMMSSDMSSMMGGMPPMRGMQMPQMGGFDMPGLSFREMPDMPLSPGGASTQSQPEMNHKVQKTEDYVPPSTSQTAEATVLLKVKEGDEYKPALNMQQYSPEDITIKLNGQEL